MGDRVSIQFANHEDKSVVLFSHWGGMAFVFTARDYAKRLINNRQEGCYPLDRFEPQTVMVDFIRAITKDMEAVESDLYLGVDENDGDNSDNGHFVIDFAELLKEGQKEVPQ